MKKINLEKLAGEVISSFRRAIAKSVDCTMPNIRK